MKTFLAALAVLSALAQPALAQAFCACDGTGNVLKFTNNPITYQNPPPARTAIGWRGLDAFAMAPARPVGSAASDDPAATGGGSAGYNRNLRNY